MIKLSNVEVMYLGLILVLKGVSMQIPSGQIVALLGGNGGGKSTTVKAICGLLEAEEGRVTGGSIDLDGSRLDRMDAVGVVKSGVVSVQEGRQILEHMTVERALMLAAHFRKDRASIRKDLDRVYSYFPVLQRVCHRVAGYLSGGEQQMLVIGQALMANPKYVVLDEPSQGLAPLVAHEIFEILRRQNEEGKLSMIVVEQNVKMALDIAHYGYVMENGRIVLDGTASELQENPDIKEFYLGMSSAGSRRNYRDVKHYTRRKRWV